MENETPTPRTDAVMLSSNWPYYITSEMKKLERELAEKTNEVERLRELLNRAIELAEEFQSICYDTDAYYEVSIKLDKFKAEASLAPAPEESVTDKNTELNTDKNTGQPVSNSDWRELGQDEMPLEDELKDIGQYADKQNDFYTCRVFQSIEYALHYLRDEIQRIDRALNVGEEDSSHNFVEINNLRDEIQKLKQP